MPKLLEYLIVAKRIGQLAEGKQAWLKHVKSGLIHGRVDATGTRTSRCAHRRPNLGQVPRNTSPYGERCRALFRPTRHGNVMVGCDASGLELRMLAHRMAYFDGGEFGKLLLDDDRDPHSEWQKSTGIFIRDNQKTFTYAMLYGAGNEKLGVIILEDWRAALRDGLVTDPVPPPTLAEDLGKAARGSLLSDLPALDMLLDRCKAASERGWFRALDGRILICKTAHGSLNDLLQSDGAILMKHALVHFDNEEREHADLFDYLLNVHDEWQIETAMRDAVSFGESMVRSIVAMGPALEMRIPIDAKYKIGANWKETH